MHILFSYALFVSFILIFSSLVLICMLQCLIVGLVLLLCCCCCFLLGCLFVCWYFLFSFCSNVENSWLVYWCISLLSSSLLANNSLLLLKSKRNLEHAVFVQLHSQPMTHKRQTRALDRIGSI